MLYIITGGKNHSTFQSFGAAATMKTKEARLVNEGMCFVIRATFTCTGCMLSLAPHDDPHLLAPALHDAQYLPALNSSVPHKAPHLLASQNCLFSST